MYRALAHCCLFVMLWLFTSRGALAQDEQGRRATFERAQVHMRNEQWDKARLLLESLWRERNTYDVALQLGQAEFQLKQFRQAAEHLAFGLAMLPPREKLQTAARSRQILDLCRQEVGTLGLTIKNKGADVLVDGKPVGTSPLLTDVYVEPGDHRFEVRLAAHRSEAWSMQFHAGQVQTRLIELSAAAPVAVKHDSAAKPAAKAKVAPTVGPSARATTHASYVPVIAGGIVTVAGLAAGIGLQLMRSSRANEQQDIQSRLGSNGCRNPSPTDLEACDKLRTLGADYDSFGRLELLSFLIGGLSLAGTGTYFLVARPDRERSASAGLGRIRFDASLGAKQSRLTLAVDF